MNVVLGVTGSIAGYKALELARLLRKNGHEVRFILTEHARHFVTPLSCQTLSDNPVYDEQFTLDRGMKHLTLAEWGDVFTVAPASADILGKARAGIGDDLLSTTLISFPGPVLFVPAMDSAMWRNPAVRENVEWLRAHGRSVMEPAIGALASGKRGPGRFPDIEMVYRMIRAQCEKRSSLGGLRVLVVGGRTEEDIDQVRVVTNRSSGMMALELFAAAICRDADVRLVLGEHTARMFEGYEYLSVRTAREMLEAMRENVDWCELLVMAAAVGDYRPKRRLAGKVHSSSLRVELEKNPDLLAALARFKGQRRFVGFSLESSEPAMRAKKKLRAKGLDYIILNEPSAIGNAQTSASIMDAEDKVTAIGRVSKWELANRVLDLAVGAGSRRRRRS